MALFMCVFLLSACAGTLAFNVDIPSRVVYRGNYQSMFGFSVQAHVDGDRRMILVGAPEDDPYRAEGVTRPGAVYRCAAGHRLLSRDSAPLDMCSVMDFDKNHGNSVDRQQRQIDQKSGQWFGATLSSTGRNGPIVACAPRYVLRAKTNQRDPVGHCFVAQSTEANDANQFSPCRHQSSVQRKTGTCQAGFAAAISKDGQRLFMGAPGSFFWQGQLYSQSANQQPVLLATSEASDALKYDDSYMGYSVTVGDFAGEGIQAVAVGVPRGSDLKGLVVLYTWELQNIKNISGSQIGAYFGYSLASGDIDGDGADDVIVGAPMFTKPKSDGYEHGRIYVIYQGRDRTFSRNHARTGEVSRGRFGLAVTSLGDINYDGFGDIAVGAPYGGPTGRGVVYIYHGGASGISEKYSQAITAEDIGPAITTFGFSLSGGVDLDNNNYTDLAVGAYKSDSVVFLKSRPVVKVMADVKFLDDSKLISITDKRCTLGNGTQVACAQLMYCLTYNGVNVEQQINFEVVLELDSRKKTSKRIFLERHETTYRKHILLTQNQQACEEVTVYMDEEIRDKLTPIEVKMTYNLVSQPSGAVVPPVLDQTQSIIHTDSLNIQKNCGPDNICIPNLRMDVSTPTVNYELGSGENVNIDVTVDNAAEDAYEAAYYLRVPEGVTYAKMERLDKDNADLSPIYCSIIGLGGNTTVKCDLGNPMGSEQYVKFRLILEVEARVTNLNFDMVVNSTNPEQGTMEDNTKRMAIAVVVRAHLSMIAKSDPPELFYNLSLYSSGDLSDDTKLGPQIVHKYNIKNEGPFAVDEAEIYVMWPYETLTGENLMYMLVQPQWLGNVKCDVARHVNPDNLNIQNPYYLMLAKEKKEMMSSDLYSNLQISGGDEIYGQTYWKESNAGFYGGGNEDQEHYGSPSTSHFSQSSQSGSHYGQAGGQYGQAGGQNGQAGGHYGQVGGQYEQVGGQYGQSGVHYGQAGSHHQAGGHIAQGSTQTGQSSSQFGSHNAGSQGSQGQYGQSWSTEHHEGLSLEEQEKIRKQLEAAVLSGQGTYNQGSYGGQGGKIVRVRNKTILYDENHNIISQTESSTEYGNLGHEGEAGSSFNKYNSQGSFNQGSVNQGSYNQGSYNQNRGSQSSQGTQGFVHGNWATTETVNSNVMNQGSTTFHGSGITVVGDEDDELEGFAVNAAKNKNNQFSYGIGEVTGASGNGGASSQSGGGSYQSGGGSYQAGGASVQSGGGSFQSGGGSFQSGGGTYQSGGGNYQAGGGSMQAGGASYGSRSGSSYSYSSSSHSGGPTSHSSQSGSGIYGTPERRETTRRKRQDEVDNQLKEILERCQAKYKCEVFRCTTGRLAKGQEVWFAMRSRLNASVLNEISSERAIKLSSLAVARVTRLPIVGRPADGAWRVAEAGTLVTPRQEAAGAGGVPLWVIILAACAGALLLLLLVLLLYKCGFFKRNRPSDHAERQPLNGRDEHL